MTRSAENGEGEGSGNGDLYGEMIDGLHWTRPDKIINWEKEKLGWSKGKFYRLRKDGTETKPPSLRVKKTIESGTKLCVEDLIRLGIPVADVVSWCEPTDQTRVSS